MSSYDYPHTCYGVEAYTADKGWALLYSIHPTRAAATKFKQSITGQHGFEASDLRVATLTITRDEPKGDTP